MTIQIPLKVKTRYVHGEIPDPSEVTIGELLINSADGTLWTKKNDGTIHDIVAAGGMAPNIYDPDNIEENVYDRSNHIGIQSTDTIHDFADKARAAAPVQSVQGREGDVTITKGDVGLGNVDNTSDANKPISAQQTFFVINKITEHENSTDPHPQYREATDAVDERVDSLVSDLEDISDLTTLLSEKVDLSYVDAAFPTVVDNIFASVDDLPVIDGSSISKIFVVDGIAYTLGVDIDDSSGDAQYIQSWKAKAKVKSGQLIKNLADGLFYKFEASSWIQSAAPDTMAYISDTSGKIFTDPIIISGVETISDLDYLITPGFYVLHDSDYLTGIQITVLTTPTQNGGTLYSQIIYAITEGLVYFRYRIDEDGEPPGEWSPIQTSISQDDIDQWYGSYTYEQPNAVLTYDPDTSKFTVKKSSAVLVPEAPSDGKQYARKDGAWAEVTSSGATSSVVPLLEVSGASHTFVKADVNKYARYTDTGAKMATFDSSEGFAAGDEFHITNRAASGNITISGTGVTFNAPKGGTLVLEPADTVTVKFISPTEADVMGSVEVGGATSLPTDDDFDNVAALLHFNGPQGSTTITDSSKLGQEITTSGSIFIDQTQSVFGGASLRCGAGRATIPSIALGSGDFTVEFRIRINALPSAQVGVMGNSTAGGSGWSIGLGTAGNLFLSISATGSITYPTTNLSAGVWYHIAFVRLDGVLYSYLNGIKQPQTGSSTSNLPSIPIFIGVYDNSTDRLDGWIDELRITPKIARYTKSFTVPNKEYPNAAP